ncbi:MAG: hypothetical protein ACLFS3_02105 [Candidatus Aenigmatarchaeota archaeon]
MSLVKRFLDRGKLIHPDLYGMIKDWDGGEERIRDLFQADSLVLTKMDLKNVEIPRPKVINVEEKRHGKVHVSDFTEFYHQRFDFLKNEVKDKLDVEEITSIDRLNSGEASVIGMVRDVNEEVILEDKTGKLHLKTKENLLEDEVIGVKGDVMRNGDEVRMIAKKIFYPDVPLRKEVNKMDQNLKGLFVSDLREDMMDKVGDMNVDYIFVTGELDVVPKKIPVISLSKKHKHDENVISGEDPLWLELGGLRILLHDGKVVDKMKNKLGADQTKTMISLLKKRHLKPYEMHSLEDKYFLKEIPDIIHIRGEAAMANYKGVTLLSSSQDTAYLVNFKTREMEEVEF